MEGSGRQAAVSLRPEAQVLGDLYVLRLPVMFHPYFKEVSFSR